MISNPIVVYTDGACKNNPGGTGGWALVALRDTGFIKTGGAFETTNHRMELMAILQALKSFPNKDLIIRTDSRYSIDCIERHSPIWKKNDWKKEDGSSSPNVDLLKKIDRQIGNRKVLFEWIKGHYSDAYNIEADRLAKEAAAALLPAS